MKHCDSVTLGDCSSVTLLSVKDGTPHHVQIERRDVFLLLSTETVQLISLTETKDTKTHNIR